MFSVLIQKIWLFLPVKNKYIWKEGKNYNIFGTKKNSANAQGCSKKDKAVENMAAL